MTIISILIAFALCHFVRELGQFRSHEWLGTWVDFSNNTFSEVPGWENVTGFLFILLAPPLVLVLLYLALESLLGPAGVFLLALAVLIYCFGPRDLDSDVAKVVKAEDEEERESAISNLLGRKPPEDEEGCKAAMIDAVFLESLRRWFAVIFWFAVLGIVGALLYRMLDWLQESELNITDNQRDLVRGMQQIMDWPAAQLTTLALAIATDFDSVYAAWKKYHDQQGHGLFEGDNGFLLASARTIVLSGHAARDGYADQLEGPLASLQQAIDLAWRVLGVWLTVLALLLLIDVIS
ncbi:MAG TPA: cobalamin biosynthesis protein [Xanthomonadales bacterium]|nr:cobalamin biosynthesis protein [Xanthomonadales bacterium]